MGNMGLLTEHDFTPGTVYSNALILETGGAIINDMELNESTENGMKVTKFRGKFQEAEAINKNKRMYPFNILNQNVERLTENITGGGLVGELDHPTDSIIHFANASHKITKLYWEGKVLMGEGEILNTPYGKILKALINDGVRIGISSRGVGNGKVNEEGVLVIGESYKLITFDAVADPSTYSAFQEKVVSKKESVSFDKEHNLAAKNESSSIHNNKQLIMACVGGLVQKHTNEIIARLTQNGE